MVGDAISFPTKKIALVILTFFVEWFSDTDTKSESIDPFHGISIGQKSGIGTEYRLRRYRQVSVSNFVQKYRYRWTLICRSVQIE